MGKKFYTVKEAAKHLGISRDKFWRLRKEFPLLPTSLVGRYEEADLDNWFHDPNKVSSYKEA